MQYNLVNRFVIFVGTEATVQNEGGSDLSFNTNDIIEYTSDRKTYYCNPKSSNTNNYNIVSSTNYDFRIYCKNDLLDTDYNISTLTNLTTLSVSSPSAINTANFNTQTTGFYSEFIRQSGNNIDTIRITIPVSALTASGVKASLDSSDPDNEGIYWKDFRIKYSLANAIDNYTTANDSISWSGLLEPTLVNSSSNVSISGNIVSYKNPGATTQINDITVDINITSSLKNNFFKFVIDAKNNINQTDSGWSTESSPYYLRYGKPEQPPKPSITLQQTDTISYNMIFSWSWATTYKTSVGDSVDITTIEEQDTHKKINLSDYEFVIESSTDSEVHGVTIIIGTQTNQI